MQCFWAPFCVNLYIHFVLHCCCRFFFPSFFLSFSFSFLVWFCYTYLGLWIPKYYCSLYSHIREYGRFFLFSSVDILLFAFPFHLTCFIPIYLHSSRTFRLFRAQKQLFPPSTLTHYKILNTLYRYNTHAILSECCHMGSIRSRNDSMVFECRYRCLCPCLSTVALLTFFLALVKTIPISLLNANTWTYIWSRKTVPSMGEIESRLIFMAPNSGIKLFAKAFSVCDWNLNRKSRRTWWISTDYVHFHSVWYRIKCF